MAEALGAAASVISIVAFAGQIAQSSAFLHNLFKDAHNASADIKALTTELGLLTSILNDVRNSNATPTPRLDEALTFCNGTISDLMALLKGLDPEGVTHKKQQMWKKLKKAMGKDDITKHLAAVERAKTLLLQCCATMAT